MDNPPLPIPDDLRKATSIFSEHGFQCWLVGGAVRDGFLGRISDDFDLATDATPESVQRIFKRTIPTGMQHGTITILLGRHQFETTTFRRDGDYSDGRRPDSISYADNILEDLARRDFTINAIAYDLVNGRLADPHNGRDDLQQKIIRAIGNPVDRLKEDGLRSIRACRIAGQLEFRIEKQTKEAISSHHANISGLSAERVWVEFKKIMAVPAPSISMELFRETGLLELLLPEFHWLVNDRRGSCGEAYTKSLRACDAASSENFPLRLAALFHSLGDEHVEAILRRYKASNADRERTLRLVRERAFEYRPDWSDGEIRRFMAGVGLDLLDDLLALKALVDGNAQLAHIHELDQRISCVLKSGDPLSVKDLSLNGSILMDELHMKKGRKIGNLLGFLLDQVLENPALNNRETLLELGRNWLKDSRQ